MTAKDLKNALLQEAVQGKLVPQIVSEGNARYLLEEIRKEKAKLIKEGKIKKEKPFHEITEEEMPFDIPESWCWCRLGEICTKLVDGDHNPPTGLQEKTEYLMLSSRNINDDKLVDLDLVRYLSKEVFEKENERTNAEKGDIFFTSVGTLGRSCIFDGSINVSFQRSVSVIKTEIFNYYLKYCLDSGFVQNFVVKNATGTAQKGFYLNQLAELLIPLPPLAEQKRILAAIEKFMQPIEEYGKKETELKALNEQIGALTKKAILQEAVQGKLVPHMATDGTAKDLLEEIKKEKAKLIKEGKIKKEKPLPEITEEELPFDIPENWCWCRLGELGITNTGTTPSKSERKYFGNYIDFLSPGDLDGSIITYGNLGLSEEGYKVARPTPKGTIIQVCIGGSIGKCAIVDREVTFNQQINSISPIELGSDYIYYTISSDFFYKNIRESATGTATPIINKSNWERLLIPLPPLAEQKRIVAAIERILPLCEKLGV